MAESQSLSILRSLQAENMLQGWGIVKVLKEIRPSMFYGEKPFSDHFDAIQVSISQIGWMKLRSHVDITTASEYLVELATNYERILDGVNRCTMDTQSLLGRCKTILAKIETLRGPFHVLWSIGAGEMTVDCAGLKKVKDADWKALASMEFTTLVEEADQELKAMIEALGYTLDNLKTMRRTAAETYAIGKDQVNAALSDLDQSDHGIGQGTGQVPQRSSIVALQGLFGSRVKAPQTGTQVEDVLPGDDPEPGEEPLAPESPVEPPPAPEPPKEEKPLLTQMPEVTPPSPQADKPRRERKSKDLSPTVTVVAPPAEPQVEAPAIDPDPATHADVQKAIQSDPFISSAQKTEILKKVETPAPVQEDDDLPEVAAAPAKAEDDDFPGEVPAPTPAPEEDDDFPQNAAVVNATPASKELAAQAETKPAEPETKPAVPETPAPAAETKPIVPAPKTQDVTKPAETKARPAGGLFGKRTPPPNMTAAPTFAPKSLPAGSSNEGLEEFM